MNLNSCVLNLGRSIAAAVSILAASFLLAPAGRAATFEVAIQNFSFTPATLTVSVGDTVRWTQKDSVTHTTTSGANGVADGVWNSGSMTTANNTVFSFTFTQAGTFPYFCMPHSSFMRGTITVKSAASPPTVRLVSPVDQATFLEPATITLTADATPGSSPISMVEFFSNGSSVGMAMTAPFSLTLSNVMAGGYALTAKVTDTASQSATSAAVNVTVTQPVIEPMNLQAHAMGSRGLALSWTGGRSPYLIQKKATLADAAWASVLTTAETNATVSQDTPGSGFYRVMARATNEVMAYTAWMTGAAEKPTAVTTAASGFGSLTMEGTKLSVNISYSGLSGPATAAHIHGPAASSESTGVMLPLTVPAAASGTITGTYDLSQLTAAQMAALMSGKTYVNIHTASNKAGEIRGQVAPLRLAASLDGASEKPNAVTTTGTGTGVFYLVGNELNYWVNYSGLSGPASAAHVHGPADTSNSAGVLQGLKGSLGVAGTLSGTLTLTVDQVGNVVDGLTYVNVHTGAHGAGEIRGQIHP